MTWLSHLGARLTVGMLERWLIAERDRDSPRIWWYGISDSPDGALPPDALRYHYDASTNIGEPIDDPGDLYPTVALLVRMAGDRGRISWDLTYRPVREPPPRPTPPPRHHVRSTAGKAKGVGETLAQRADRARRQPPRAAA